MGRKSAYHHGDLKKALISTAIGIVEGEGVEGLTMRKAARRAGVSHAAPAHHFGDRNGLLAAIAKQGFGLLSGAMRRAAEECGSSDALTRFKAAGMAYIEFAAAHAAYFKIMHHPLFADKSPYPDLELASRETFDLIVAEISECRRQGFFQKADVREMALFAWTTVHGFASLAVNGQIRSKGYTRDLSTLADSVTGMIFQGLRA